MKFKAIILAAGIGSRLGPKGKNIPKCLLRIPHQNKTIIERQIEILYKNKVNNIHVITGYKSKLIKKKLGKKVNYHYFKKYRNCNNLQTLYHFRKLLNSNVIILFADVIFDNLVIKNLLKIKKTYVAAIDTNRVLKDTMKIKIIKKKIVDIGSHLKVKNSDGNFIGILKLLKKGAQTLKKEISLLSSDKKNYYTIAINSIIKKNLSAINFYNCKNCQWREIDNIKNYKELKKIKFR